MQDFSEIPSAEKEARETLSAKTTDPSVVTAAGGDPGAKVIKGFFLGREKANESKSKEDHNVSTHFSKVPNCVVCRMTKTTRSSWKSRHLKLTGRR